MQLVLAERKQEEQCLEVQNHHKQDVKACEFSGASFGAAARLIMSPDIEASLPCHPPVSW